MTTSRNGESRCSRPRALRRRRTEMKCLTPNPMARPRPKTMVNNRPSMSRLRSLCTQIIAPANGPLIGVVWCAFMAEKRRISSNGEISADRHSRRSDVDLLLTAWGTMTSWGAHIFEETFYTGACDQIAISPKARYAAICPAPPGGTRSKGRRILTVVPVSSFFDGAIVPPS
jgi:hypothetical protein